MKNKEFKQNSNAGLKFYRKAVTDAKRNLKKKISQQKHADSALKKAERELGKRIYLQKASGNCEVSFDDSIHSIQEINAKQVLIKSEIELLQDEVLSSRSAYIAAKRSARNRLFDYPEG